MLNDAKTKKSFKYVLVIVAVVAIVISSLLLYRHFVKKQMTDKYNAPVETILKDYNGELSFDNYTAIDTTQYPNFATAKKEKIKYGNLEVTIVYTTPKSCPFVLEKPHAEHSILQILSIKANAKIAQPDPNIYCLRLIEKNNKFYEITREIVIDYINPQNQIDYQNLALLLGVLPKKSEGQALIFDNDYIFTNVGVSETGLKFNCRVAVAINLKSTYKEKNGKTEFQYFAHGGGGFANRYLNKITITKEQSSNISIITEKILSCASDIVC